MNIKIYKRKLVSKSHNRHHVDAFGIEFGALRLNYGLGKSFPENILSITSLNNFFHIKHFRFDFFPQNLYFDHNIVQFVFETANFC